jgi:hypothetical protein
MLEMVAIYSTVQYVLRTCCRTRFLTEFCTAVTYIAEFKQQSSDIPHMHLTHENDESISNAKHLSKQSSINGGHLQECAICSKDLL